MGLGLIAMVAAATANAGESIDKVVEEIKRTIPKIHFLALFDTLKYLALGGRIGRAKALLGSILNVKPMLSLKEGEVVPAGQVRTRVKGIDRLFEFAQNAVNIQDLAIVYNTALDEAQNLVERIGSIVDREKIKIARIGPVLGVHMGPGALVVVIREL
jgi:DegV family protein with EDD domain